MIRLACICIVFSSLSCCIAFKWIPSSSGDPIPQNVLYLSTSSSSSAKIIARARHFDEVLAAELELTDGNYAKIRSCSKISNKFQYEILVLDAGDLCEWRKFSNFHAFPIDVVRGGTTANGEPLFIGSISDYYSTSRRYLASIQFSTQKFNVIEENVSGYNYYLACKQNATWIDILARDVPKNAITGGKSKTGKNKYVGRVKSGCTIIPGEVVPHLEIATGILENGTEVTSTYTQVLIGEAKDYSWKRSTNGEIPDYAVVSSQASNGELMYVSRKNNKLGYILHSKAAWQSEAVYDMLVKN